MTAIRSALVVGGTGFIGSALLRRLVAEGVEAHALTFRDRVPKLLSAGRPLASASSSVEDLAAVFSGYHFDTVFHLAAAGVAPGHRSLDSLVEGNLGLLTRVLESLSLSPPGAFIFTGSCAEYSEAPPGTLIAEDWPTLPNNLYGGSKAAATILGTALARKLEMPFATLRLFHVFGPGESSDRLIPSLICALRRNEKLKLTGGRQVRDLLHVDDAIEALIAAASRRLSAGEVFNVCSGRPVSVRDVALELARLLGRSQHLLDFGALPYRRDEPMWLAGTNRRFAEATGWSPSLSLEEGLRSMLDCGTNTQHGL